MKKKKKVRSQKILSLKNPRPPINFYGLWGSIPVFDGLAVVPQVLTHHSTAGIAPTEVLESQSWAFMVINKKDADAVLAVDALTGFEGVKAPLQRLVEASMSGQRLFGSCWKELAAELLKKEVMSAKKSLLEALSHQP